MWLNALTTFDVGRCACSSSDVVVDSLSSSGDLAVSLRVVVVGVDDDLARQWLDRHDAIVPQRNRDHDDVAGLAASAAVAALAFGPSSATRSASVSGPRELLITTRSRRERPDARPASDVSCTDESERLHDVTSRIGNGHDRLT